MESKNVKAALMKSDVRNMLECYYGRHDLSHLIELYEEFSFILDPTYIDEVYAATGEWIEEPTFNSFEELSLFLEDLAQVVGYTLSASPGVDYLYVMTCAGVAELRTLNMTDVSNFIRQIHEGASDHAKIR